MGGRPDGALNGWIDRRVLDITGESIGVVVDIYADGTNRHPAWLAISTGLLDTPIAVPIVGASQVGEDVVVAHDRHTVFTAPGDAALLADDPGAERAIASHYGVRSTIREPSPRSPG